MVTIPRWRGILIAVFAVVLVGHETGFPNETSSSDPPVDPPGPTVVRPELPEGITVVAAGDIMPGSMTPIPFFPSPTDQHIPTGIRRLVGRADLVFGNFEGTFATWDMLPQKCRPETREARRCFEFGAPPFLASFLKEAGFTVLSLDNNHAEDYGLEGYALTQGLLAQIGLLGVPKRTPVGLAIRDIRVTVVPFGFSARSFHLSDLPTATSVVSEASRNADIVIVSFHGGAEGEDATRVRDEVETYLDEDRGNAIRFAHAVVDAGADLVIGHGPHVPRAMELYRDRLIAYSLGNFWTYGNISIKGSKGIMPLLRVVLAPNGAFVSGQIVSMRQQLPGVPEMDPDGQAVRLIKTLSRDDFPLNAIEIDESGTIGRRRAETGTGAEQSAPDYQEIN
jgi:hypothetical protein